MDNPVIKNSEMFMDKFNDYKLKKEKFRKELGEAQETREELIQDIMHSKIPSDLREIYPCLAIFAEEQGYSAVRIFTDAENTVKISLCDKEEYGVKECKDTFVIVDIMQDAWRYRKSDRCIFVDAEQVDISRVENQPSIALSWGDKKEQILTALADTLDKYLAEAEKEIKEMQTGNNNLRNRKPFSVEKE